YVRSGPALRAKSSEIRRLLRIPEEGRVVALSGRIVSWKGHREFIEAAALVLKQCPTAYFLLIGGVSDGEPSFFDELMTRAGELGLGDRVICTGFVVNVRDYLEVATVLVHASIEPEPFGLVIVEGMDAAKPMIASKRGAGEEIIQDGVDGYLVDPTDSEIFAA